MRFTDLLENYIILKDNDKELYYDIKDNINDYMNMIKEYLSYKLIIKDNFIKLEKVPANPQGFMGIKEFDSIKEYVFFMILLIFLEDKNNEEQFILSNLTEYIKQNYNQNLSVESLANILGIERSYLSRLFKTYKNKSTQNYIIDYRMRQAKRMFEEEDMNVSQVCAAVGYTNIYCFSRIFKSRVGMPPKEYMERCRRHGA